MSNSQRPFWRPSLLLLVLATLLLAGCGTQANNENWPGLSTDGQMVYVAYGPAVAAYDAVEREESWVFKPEGNGRLIYANPSVQDGRVVIGDYGAAGGMFSPAVIVDINGLDTNGSMTPGPLWLNNQSAADKIVAGPLQIGDVVYIASADFNLLALHAESGAELWRFPTNGAIWAQPTYYDGVLYVTSLDRHVYALQAETGAEIWRQELAGAISAQVVLNPEENLLYVGAYDNAMHALDMNSGDEQWQVETTNWIWSAPAVTEGKLYFVDSGAQVYAVDAVTGDSLWTASVNQMRTDGVLTTVEGAVQASPVVADGKVFIASEGNRNTKEGLLVVLDAETGEEVWQRTTSGPLFTTPVIGNEVLVVAMNSEEAVLAAFDLETGNQQWAYQPITE